MLGQWTLDAEEADWDPVVVWLPVEVAVVVVIVAAKTAPTEESAATIETARIEYARRLLLLLPKPILKLILSFHLPRRPDRAPVIADLQERPRIINGFFPNG